MLPEDAILLPEIVDEIFLVAISPTQPKPARGSTERGAWPEATWLRRGRHPRCLEDSFVSAVFSHHTPYASRTRHAGRQKRPLTST